MSLLDRLQTGSEDLTTKIVDNDAAIRAKIALRDRLQALVAYHSGKLSALLISWTDGLAEVRAEIDAARSDQAVMGPAGGDVGPDHRRCPDPLATSRTWSPVTAAGAFRAILARW